MSLFGEEIEDNGFDDGDLTPAVMPTDTLQPPQSSSLLLGHEQIEHNILSLWQSGRMPHALVLNGLKGIGKSTFAYRLARFVMKESEGGDAGGLFGEDVAPTSLDTPPDHSVFSKIASGGHPDMMVITRPFDDRKGQYKDDIPVDTIRKVAPFLRKTSSNGGWRVVIIDDANTMNRNGQNALLKILEEPPKNALLILVTHGAGGLLPTIRSRCRFVAFDKLDDNHITTLLNKAADGHVMPTDADIVTSLAEGSAGQAIELYQEGGVEAVNILLGALAQIHDMSEAQIDALALFYGKSGDSKIIDKFTFILNWWFEKLIHLAAQGLKTTQVGGIDIVIPTGHDLKSLLQLHEDVEAHIQTCINGNLDKRYMIYKTLRIVQG